MQLEDDTKNYFYYGTADLKIDTDLNSDYKLNPDFNGKRKFEFGNGFYLTPDRNLAESYIRRNHYIKEIKDSSDDEAAIKEFKNGLNIIGNLHIYNLNYNELKSNTVVEEFEEIDRFKIVLKETLEGYDNYRDYRPNRDATFGTICGKVWDDYWTEGNPKYGTLTHNELIKECIEEVEQKIQRGIKQRQICIHRLCVGSDKKNVFNEYLKKETFEEITS